MEQQPWARQGSSPPPLSPAPPPRPPRRLQETPGGKILIGLGVLFALALLYIAFLLIRNTFTPKFSIPIHPYPSPNAFRVYENAGKRIVRKEDVAAAFDSKSPHKFSDAEKAKLVADNAAALAEFRRGFKMEYRSPAVRSISQKLPYLADFRTGARLMNLEGYAELTQGDAAGATASGLDAVQFGRHISTGSSLIGGLVSIACQAIGRAVVWKSAERLSGAAAKTAARRLAKIRALGVPYATMLQEEQYTAQAALRSYFKHPEATIQGMSDDETENDGSDVRMGGLISRVLFVYYGKQRILDDLNQTFERAIAQAKKPYADDHAPLPKPGDYIVEILLPVIEQGRIKFVRNETQNALLLTTLALRAYRQERGAYPATLEPLVPAYLSRLPDDPFAKSGSLRYFVVGDKYLLYSVGPDGSDDVGKPLEIPGATPEDRRQAYPQGKGDIIAGKNL